MASHGDHFSLSSATMSQEAPILLKKEENVSEVNDTKISLNLNAWDMEKLSCRTCFIHPRENRVFHCENHGEDCCVLCVAESHTGCSPVLMEDIFRKFYSFLETANVLRQNIDGEEGNLQSYFRRLKTHFLLGEKQIKSLFDEIRKKVDAAEKTTLSKFEEVKNVKLFVISENFDNLNELKKEVETVLKDGDRLYNNIISQTQSNTIPSVELNELMKSNNMEMIKKKLNKLNEIVKGTDMNFVTWNDQKMQNMDSSLSDIVTIRGVESPVPNKQYLPCGQISCQIKVQSMCIIPNTEGEMYIVTEKPNRLIYIDLQGTVIKYVDLPSDPYDLCVWRSNVTVTLYSGKQMISYRTSDLSVNAAINLPSGCGGICCVRNMFVITFPDEGVVRSVNDNGQIIRSSHKLFRFPTFVRFSEHAYCTLISDSWAHEVVALSVDLTTVLFKMSHTDLQFPFGLCINECGGVYVCSYRKHCVVEFTKEGKYISTILPAEQLGITKPWSICYGVQNECLYVASLQSDAIRAYKGQ